MKELFGLTRTAMHTSSHVVATRLSSNEAPLLKSFSRKKDRKDQMALLILQCELLNREHVHRIQGLFIPATLVTTPPRMALMKTMVIVKLSGSSFYPSFLALNWLSVFSLGQCSSTAIFSCDVVASLTGGTAAADIISYQVRCSLRILHSHYLYSR